MRQEILDMLASDGWKAVSEKLAERMRVANSVASTPDAGSFEAQKKALEIVNGWLEDILGDTLPREQWMHEEASTFSRLKEASRRGNPQRSASWQQD